MMTFNEKHHWVFPLVPTACDYAKLNEHFGPLQNSQIEVLQSQVDFGGNLSVPKALCGKRNDCDVKLQVPKR